MLTIVLTARKHAALLAIHIYSYVARKSLILVSICIVIDIYINQPHLLGSCRICANMAKGTWYHIPVRASVCMCASMMEHSFIINLVIQSYHIYKDGWDTLILCEVLYYEREIENYNDPCATHPRPVRWQWKVLTLEVPYWYNFISGGAGSPTVSS